MLRFFAILLVSVGLMNCTASAFASNALAPDFTLNCDSAATEDGVGPPGSITYRNGNGGVAELKVTIKGRTTAFLTTSGVILKPVYEHAVAHYSFLYSNGHDINHPGLMELNVLVSRNNYVMAQLVVAPVTADGYLSNADSYLFLKCNFSGPR